jgi:hypothetical protein
VTSKRVGGVEERARADMNKDTRDRDCKDLFTRGESFFPSAKRLRGEIGSCWRCVFSIFPKIKGLGESFGTLGDALSCGYIMLYQTRQCLLCLLLRVES